MERKTFKDNFDINNMRDKQKIHFPKSIFEYEELINHSINKKERKNYHINKYVNDTHYYYHLLLPGLNKECLKVFLENNKLLLQYKDESPNLDVTLSTCDWVECPKEFNEYVTLPNDIDYNKIKVEYQSGILKIAMEKISKKRQILF